MEVGPHDQEVASPKTDNRQVNFSWFSTPGPQAFIESLSEDFRQGCSIFLQAPTRLHDDILSALETVSESDSVLRWLPLEVASEKPDVQLSKLLGIPLSGDNNDWIPGLYRSDTFKSAIIVLRLILPEKWDSWTAFLSDFAHFNQGVPSLVRSVFLVVTSAGPRPILKREELLLKCRLYNGVADPWDMMIYSYYLMKGREIEPQKKQLLATLCTELSLWDHHLCEFLVKQSVENLLRPYSLLSEYAGELGWGKKDQEPEIEEKWREGICLEFCRANEKHSSFLSLNGDLAQIDHRLWKAQISVVYPHLERQRRSILKKYSYLLSVPHSDPSGATITDLEDLDFGHINHQIRSNPQIDPAFKRKIDALWRARNHLAHMEPLAPSLFPLIMPPVLDLNI